MKLFLIMLGVLFHCALDAKVFLEPPPNYNPKVEVSACFYEVDDQVLFLLRNPESSEGNTWGIPGGKMEKGETPQQNVIREFKEETGVILPADQLIYWGTVYIRYPKTDFTYHIFRITMCEKPAIVIDPKEHQAYRWMRLDEALKLPLIPDEDECIYLVYGRDLANCP